jgi:RNA polymerase sigma factor (sigma-70 family)
VLETSPPGPLDPGGPAAPQTPAAPTTSDRDCGEIYERYLRLMMWIARRRFRIPDSEAEPLVHEVFVNFLIKMESVSDIRAWLVAAISNACRYYLRVRDRCETLPDDFAERPDPHLAHVLDLWPDQLAAQQAIAATTARCQLVLRLRYFEGYSVPEIAAELKITIAYATKLVGECVRQARRRYARLEGRTQYTVGRQIR